MSTPPATPPSSPPRSSSPAKSFRARMGTMMRRTSSGLAFNKAGHGLLRSESKSSLKSLKVDAAQAPSTPEHSLPSPVIESPTREAGEDSPMLHVHMGPSPLHVATNASVEDASQTSSAAADPVPASGAIPVAQPVTAAAPDVTPIPAEPIPSDAVLASEPTEDHRDAISESDRADMVLTASPEAQINEFGDHDHAPEAIEQVIEEAKPEAIHVASTEELLPISMPEPEPVMPSSPPVAESQQEKKGPDYFAWSDDRVVAPKWSESSLASQAAAQDIQAHTSDDAARVPHHIKDVSNAETFAWTDDTGLDKKRSGSSLAAQDALSHSREVSQPTRSGVLSSRASKSSMASSYGQVFVTAPGKRVAVALDNSGDAGRRGRSSSVVRIDLNNYDDPFADPPVPVPTHGLSPVIDIPEPESYKLPPPPQESPREESIYDFSSPPASFPLPPARDVITPNKKVRGVPSGYTLNDMSASQEQVHHDTDERLPLLQRPVTPLGGKAKQGVSTSGTVVFPTVEHVASGSNGVFTVETLGWTEHILPDSSFYYSHSGMRITTDIDLRAPKKLNAITEYIERKRPEEVALPPQGWELWLRDAGRTKYDFIPLRNWVNHKARILTLDPPPSMSGDVLPDHITDDDRLDMEYRYWTYLEAHPAHVPLPAEIRAEAMDTLTWSYTDCLLPSSKPVPPPFAPQECQELMGLFRSYDGSSKNAMVVHTRIVARVLLRVVQWRQHYFRPNKALPRDVTRGPLVVQRLATFGRRITDFFVACLCLGIPYLFLDRSHPRRIDEEGGVRNTGPMLMVAACACLVAAVILSASVTFISLPGLDDIARLAGLLAILFSASSMVSTVIALFRYKADVERTVVYVGHEGVMLLSRQSIVMSLPIVFVAWAIAAFITGITFYSFRGATMSSRITIKYPFEDYTHWAVVGTLGGLAGMLLVSAMLARR